jgi:hypothetical protein
MILALLKMLGKEETCAMDYYQMGLKRNWKGKIENLKNLNDPVMQMIAYIFSLFMRNKITIYD